MFTHMYAYTLPTHSLTIYTWLSIKTVHDIFYQFYILYIFIFFIFYILPMVLISLNCLAAIYRLCCQTLLFSVRLVPTSLLVQPCQVISQGTKLSHEVIPCSKFLLLSCDMQAELCVWIMHSESGGSLVSSADGMCIQ